VDTFFFAVIMNIMFPCISELLDNLRIWLCSLSLLSMEIAAFVYHNNKCTLSILSVYVG
jgi:hypothetical protein